MDPFTIMLMVGAASQIGSALWAYYQEAGSAEEAQKLLDTAQAKYGGINPPALEKAAAEVLGPTRLAEIVQNPEYRQAQSEALASLKQISDEGGLTATDKANLNRVMNEAQGAAKSREATILENFRNRGALGSGLELSARMGSAANAAQAQQQAGLDIAGMAQDRARQAILDRAGLASRYSDADWQRQSAAARAQDEINKANWGERRNVAQENYQRQQQDYQNRLAQGRQQMGIAGQQAAAVREAGARRANLGQQIGGALSSTAGVVGRAYTAPSTDAAPAFGSSVTAPYTPPKANPYLMAEEDSDPRLGDV